MQQKKQNFIQTQFNVGERYVSKYSHKVNKYCEETNTVYKIDCCLVTVVTSATRQHGRVVRACNMVECLECRDCDLHGPSSKPTRAILLSPWERHLTALYPAWWPWQEVLN